MLGQLISDDITGPYVCLCVSQHEDEPPQDLRQGHPGEKSLSKSALKNQKKREAKKASKELRTDPVSTPVSGPAPVSSSQSEASSGDPEMDKKIKNLKKVR